MTLNNNKRIAKNTILLYVRMVLMMLISLYTVRIVLNILGALDYGIYNLVAGVVAMFSFLTGTMASASQRFFAYELGQNNTMQLKKTFNLTFVVYGMFSVGVLILAETVGLWFINTHLQIPPNRIEAANWVFQFSILTLIINIIRIPFDAIVIAHERMNVYAYVSIIEVSFKLIIVFILMTFEFDKLKLYSMLMFFVAVFVALIYIIYCTRRFKECKLKFYWDLHLLKKIASYSGWNLFDSMSKVLCGQGGNILLGMFFNPIINAARGIAYQISVTMNQFVLNFMMASRPQIIKYYAQSENEKMVDLVIRSSKFCFYLLFVVSSPILIESNYILTLWLKDIPEYTIVFTRIIITSILVDVISYPLMTAIQATGRIRNVSVIIGSITMVSIPLSYILLRLGQSPTIVFYVTIFINSINLFVRLFFLKKYVCFPVVRFLRETLFRFVPILFIVIGAVTPIIRFIEQGLMRTVLVSLISSLSTFISIYFLGLTSEEKKYINNFIRKSKILKFLNVNI